MNVPIQNIDFSLVRHLSMRLSRRNRHRSFLHSSLTDFSSLRYEQLVPENLVEIDDKECAEILGGNTEEKPSTSQDIQDSADAVQTEQEVNNPSWFSIVCCISKCLRTNNNIQAVVPEANNDDDRVVTVTEEMRQKKNMCVQTWIALIQWELKKKIPQIMETPIEPSEPKKKENPELISRRGDIPMVFSTGKRPFSRGTHQYYRGSWRLKPSVIGAPETLGMEE